MFAPRYFAPYYFAARYFAEVGKDVAPYLRTNLAFNFNGTSQYATATESVADQLCDAGAFYGWLRPDFAPAETTDRYWFSVTQNASVLALHDSASANTMRLLNNGRVATFTTTGLWSAGQWINLVAQWDKDTDTLELYINGTAVTPSKSGTWGSETTDSALYMACLHDASAFIDGAIGRFCFWNRVLTAGEIALLQRRWPYDAAYDDRVFEIAPDSTTSLAVASDELTLVDTPTTVAGPPRMKRKAIPWAY